MPPSARRRPRPAFHAPLSLPALPPPVRPPASRLPLRAAFPSPAARVTVSLPRPLGVSLAETRALGGLSRVVVSAVEADSPADGVLRVGDVVLGLPGAPAPSLNTLVDAIHHAPPHQHVTLVLERPRDKHTPHPLPVLPDAPAEPPDLLPTPVETQQPPTPPPPPPVDDIFAHQDHAVAHLTAVYVGHRRGETPADKKAAQYALAELLSVAAGIAKSRASTSSRSPQLISSLLYRLRRASVPLDAKFYNIVMWSFISAGAPQKAVELFQEINYPNVECFTTLIKAYSMRRMSDEAIALLPVMRSRGVKPNIRTYNSLIASCVRGGKLAKAKLLFSEMLVDEIKPNAVSWNIIINWHVQQKNGPRRLRDALQAFSDMKQSGVVPNVITFTTIMKAYTKSGLLNKAEEVFAEMKQRLPSKIDTGVYNTLLRAYATRLEWRRCLELLDEMDGFYVPDGLSLARELGRENTVDGARDVPRHSRSFSTRRPWLSDEDVPDPDSEEDRVRSRPSSKISQESEDEVKYKPDAISYSLAVKACASAGRPDIAREVFDDMMERGFYPPPGPAVVSLMAGYATAGMLTESFTVLKNLKSWGVFPEERMLSSLMHGCLIANQPSLALSVYAKFKSARFSADVVTLTLLMKAYGMCGELEKAFNVVKGMKGGGRGARPSVVTYNVLIDVSVRQGRRDMALKALDLLLDDREVVRYTNRNTFAALVAPVVGGAGDAGVGAGVVGEEGALFGVVEGRVGRADGQEEEEEEGKLQYLMDVLRRVREGGVEANGTLYGALLQTCEICGEWHLGSSLVKERETGGFVVGKRERKMVRALEDAFRARSVTGPLV